MIRHIVRFSGGACSWAAAKRVIAVYGASDTTLLFADTCMEDTDLYRFLRDAETNIGVAITRIADGRTPWDVMRDERMIGNSRFDPCSKILKRQLLDKWMKANCDPESSVVYIGLDFTESHRYERFATRIAPWKCAAPMTDPPYLSKKEILAWMRAEGLVPPRLYGLGFPHNNCGGFCIKAGQAQFALLLRTMPERYRWHEEQEERLRSIVGDHSIMRDRSGGGSKCLTMKTFRERIDKNISFDTEEWGGCGCAIE